MAAKKGAWLVEEMLGCGVHMDIAIVVCGIALTCILITLYIISGHTSQISAIDHKLNIVIRKLDMFAKIIHIMSEVSKDSFEAELAKQVQETAPMDNLDVQEIRTGEKEGKEEAKEVVAQEEASELVEAEELK